MYALEEGNEPFTILIIGVLVVRGSSVGDERYRRDKEEECKYGDGGRDMAAIALRRADDGKSEPRRGKRWSVVCLHMDSVTRTSRAIAQR
jgi:hypothetical protein